MKMNFCVCWRNILSQWKYGFGTSRKLCSTAVYPPIYDESPAGKRLRKKKEWRDAICSLPTVEEKLLYMCSNHTVHKQEHDKVMGFKLNGVSVSYNSLPLRQHCSRTHLVHGLPSQYSQMNVDSVYERLKDRLVDAVVFAHEQHAHRPPFGPTLTSQEEDRQLRDRQLKAQMAEAVVFSQGPQPLPNAPTRVDKKKEDERQLANKVVDAVLRVLLGHLSNDYPHLRSAEIDINPRCESFWSSGRFYPTDYDKRTNPNKTSRNNFFFYEGKPHYQIRTTDPLSPFLSLDHELCTKSEIPHFPFDPRSIGTITDEKHLTVIPGCWPNKRSGFGHLSFHSLEDLHDRRNNLGILDEAECISEYGMIASFGWLMGIATYQGFTPWNQVTYPFLTQTVITDGQTWNFFAYQLNTNCLFNECEDNSLRNVCWDSGRLKLFDAIEDGEMKEINDEVFKLLIKMLTITPVADSENLRPYVNEDAENVDRARVDKMLRDYYTQRPLKKIREVYQWEKIYLHSGSYVSVNPNRKR